MGRVLARTSYSLCGQGVWQSFGWLIERLLLGYNYCILPNDDLTCLVLGRPYASGVLILSGFCRRSFQRLQRVSSIWAGGVYKMNMHALGDDFEWGELYLA